MFPSVLVGITGVIDEIHFFKNFGSFYTVSLLIAGFINSIIYVTLQVELRKAAKNLFERKIHKFEATTVVPFTTAVAVSKLT